MKITIDGVSIKRVKILRERQFRKAMYFIKRELVAMGIDLNKVKFEDAAKIYAEKVFGESFLDARDWVFSKVDRGYFECKKITEKELIRKEPKQHKKKKQKKQSYNEFLKSAYWKKVRLLVLKRDNNHCRSCGSSINLHIHHLTYEHHLKELNNLDDLITLCKECHNEIHGRINGKNTIPLGEYETSCDIAKVDRLG